MCSLFHNAPALQLECLDGRVAAGQAFNCSGRKCCLLYTSDAADEFYGVDLGGRRLIKNNNNQKMGGKEVFSTSIFW